MVGFEPPLADGLDHLAGQSPVGIGKVAEVLGEFVEQFGDRPEDVELDLVFGGVSDSHRSGSGVSGQVREHRLGGQGGAVDGVQGVELFG